MKEKIVDIDNIALAAYKTFRGKRDKKDVIDFIANFNENICSLRDEIDSGQVFIGDYHFFTIYDPKERVICATGLKERILHHAIMNICHARFDKSLIYDTYATRPGKGIYAALEKAQKAMKNYRYYAKLDVRKYFDNIDHVVLKQMLQRLFKDRWLLELFDRIIDSYSVTPGKGIPIGNLTSQYFANIYLSGLDHYMKEILKVPFYIRYMDDVLLYNNDKTNLMNSVSAFQNYALNELSLAIKQPQTGKCASGVSFLGYKVMPGFMLLNGRSKRRFRSKLIKYDGMNKKGELTEKEFALRLLPLIAFTWHAKARGFRRSCMELIDKRGNVASGL